MCYCFLTCLIVIFLVLATAETVQDGNTGNIQACQGPGECTAGPVLSCASCGSSQFPVPGACIVHNTTVDPSRCCADDAAVALLQRLLSVMQHEAYEATEAAVQQGDSPFGAAVLHNLPGYPLLLAAANSVQTSNNPTAHGEVTTINAYFQQKASKGDSWVNPEDTIFLATHQPCSLCLSALAFSGFRRVFYGFDFLLGVNDGEAAGSILDVAVLEQVFGTHCGRINHTNGMFTIIPLRAMLHMEPCAGGSPGLAAAMKAARQQYQEVVDAYARLGQAFQERMAAGGGGGGGGVQLMADQCKGCAPFPREDCAAEFM